MTARWRVKRGHEGIPALAIKREYPPISQPLLRRAQGRVEHEFTDRLASAGSGSLQCLLRGPSQTQIEFFRAVGTLSHGTSLITPARQCHDKFGLGLAEYSKIRPARIAAEAKLHAAEMGEIGLDVQADMHRHEMNVAPSPLHRMRCGKACGAAERDQRVDRLDA